MMVATGVSCSIAAAMYIREEGRRLRIALLDFLEAWLRCLFRRHGPLRLLARVVAADFFPVEQRGRRIHSLQRLENRRHHL